MLIRTALAGAALALLVGCATPAADPPAAEPGATEPGDPDPSDDPGIELTVTRGTTTDPAGETWTLTCDPPAGTHPAPQDACDLVAGAGPELFDPVPRDVMCTEIWGGPEVAQVVGTVAGQAVDARFARDDGCQISRWDAAQALLGSPGL